MCLYTGADWLFKCHLSAHKEMCESRGGHPGLPVLISLMVSVDIKQH